MDKVPPPRYEELQADFTGHVFCDSISDLELANISADSSFDIEARLHRQIIRVFSCGTFPETVTVHAKWPTDWWQAVRERWLPSWWLKKHPVEYRRIDIDRTIYTRICPHIKTPDRSSHVRFLFKKGEHAE